MLKLSSPTPIAHLEVETKIEASETVNFKKCVTEITKYQILYIVNEFQLRQYQLEYTSLKLGLNSL